MLTLQTLRDKGGVLLAVLIGIALLAFLLGDMLSSGSLLFGSANKVGKIEGTSINAQDYAYKLDYYTKVNEQLLGNTQDLNDQSSDQAWESFVREEVFKPQIKGLGLNTSEEESQNLLSPETPSPVLYSYFLDRSTGVFATDTYKAFLNAVNYDANGNMMDVLSYFKSESDFVSEMGKLSSLIKGGYFVTDFDISSSSQLQSVNKDIRFVYKKMSTVPDSVISYSDADVKAFYEEHKNHFRKEESKTLNYVTFNVYPSDDDFVAAQKYVEEMAIEFAASTSPKLYAEANSNDKGLSKYYKRGQLDTELSEFAFSGSDSVYGPKLQDRIYKLAKVVKVKNIPDSVELSHIMLAPDKKELADSLMNVLSKGGNFADLAMQFSQSSQTSQNGGRIGVVDPTLVGDDDMAEKIIDTPAGKCVKVELSNGIHIFRVDKAYATQPRAYVAMITYSVEPSKMTRNAVYNRASKFASSAAGGHQNFVTATTDSVLDLRVAKVNPNSKGIEGIDNSREVVTWAFAHGEEEGTSGVMEFGDQYLIATLVSSDKRGIAPLDAVRDEVVNALSFKLKAEYLKSQFASATSIDDAATKFGLTVNDAQGIGFNSYAFPSVGLNIGFAGGVMATKLGQMSKPIVTPDAVLLVEVVAENNLDAVDAGQVRETLKAEIDQYIFQSSYIDVLNKAEIIDQRYKLYR